LANAHLRDDENMPSDKIRRMLIRSMTKSKRQGLWFRLSRQERSLYTLALNLKVKFESIPLMRALVSILKRLGELGNGFYSSLVRGIQIAWVFSSAAESWGNIKAKGWRNDRNYALYLGNLFGG
jgi:hypothetical protein